jgi:hypothetical protein
MRLARHHDFPQGFDRRRFDRPRFSDRRGFSSEFYDLEPMKNVGNHRRSAPLADYTLSGGPNFPEGAAPASFGSNRT